MVVIAKCKDTDKEIISITTTEENKERLIEILIENSISLGFTDIYTEILTEEDYQARKELEPIPPQNPTLEERLFALENLELERMFEL